MKRINSNFCVFLVVLNHATIWVPMGWTIVALNPTTQVIKDFVNETFQIHYNTSVPAETSTLIITLAQAMLIVGSAIGGFSTHVWVTYFSRRTALTMIHALSVISAVLMSPISFFLNSYEALIIGRLLNGLARGIGFTLGPLYVSEIVSRKTLGLYQSPVGWILQLSAAFGNIIGHPSVLGGPFTWPFALGLPGIFSVIYLCLLPWIPQTIPHVLNTEDSNQPSYTPSTNPSFLLLQKLRSIRGEELMEEYSSIKAEIDADRAVEKASVATLFKIGRYRRQLIAVIVIQFSLQSSAIQAVFQYTNDIFIQAGVNPDHATFYTVGTLTLMALTVFISSRIVPRTGPKLMLICGLVVAIVGLLLLTISNSLSTTSSTAGIVGVIGMTICTLGLGIGPMLAMVSYASIITTTVTRPNVMWMAGNVFWITAILVSFLFPYALEAIGGFAYIPFIVVTALVVVYIVARIPHTRNRSSAEIQKFFINPKKAIDLQYIENHTTVSTISPDFET